MFLYIETLYTIFFSDVKRNFLIINVVMLITDDRYILTGIFRAEWISFAKIYFQLYIQGIIF